MKQQVMMGNEAIGLAAIANGVALVSGYPGTPSSEVLETVAKHNPGDIHVEWSTNEKVALEVAAGAAYAGARTMVTMKQVGLNVASDPLLSLASVGVKGGMIVLVADDPGPISSQTEQDTRHFGRYANLPVLDPASPEEAFAMVGAAFDLSEQIGLPVLLRPTTRICHGCAVVQLPQKRRAQNPIGFEKDPRWVVFPRLTYANHLKNEALLPKIAQGFCESPFNHITTPANPFKGLGVVASGIAHAYTQEAIQRLGLALPLLKIGTPFPFPADLALGFCKDLTQVLVLEELDGVLEDELERLVGKHHLAVDILGKGTGHLPVAGEYSLPIAEAALSSFCGLTPFKPEPLPAPPALPSRPPILCAGCPHRGAFYSVKVALKDQPYVCTGDIGCYTLGNAAPLDMVDTCLCMGGGITVAQGLMQVQNPAKHLAFIGDSTFFHSGITGIINGVYNQADITVVIVDNATTAMTGHQPHPGLGKTMMGHSVAPLSIAKILVACGVQQLEVVSPLDLRAGVEAIRRSVAYRGVSVVLFQSACVSLFQPTRKAKILKTCANCKICLKELGCPGLTISKDSLGIERVQIEPTLCYGCGLCSQVCPFKAIALIEQQGGEKDGK